MPVASPEDFPAAFVEAWRARDGHAIARLFVEDADFVNVVGIWWESREDIGRAHDYALKSFFAETRLSLGRVKLRLLGEDHALVHARMRLVGQRAPDGTEAAPRSTILSFVLRRSAGGWEGLSAQNTDIVPGAETYRAGPDGLAPANYRG